MTNMGSSYSTYYTNKSKRINELETSLTAEVFFTVWQVCFPLVEKKIGVKFTYISLKKTH